MGIVPTVPAPTKAINNPCNLRGLEFVEFATNKPSDLETLFRAFGFAKVGQHKSQPIQYWRQNDIHFLLNSSPNSFAASFVAAHGPSICALGWRVDNAKQAQAEAVKRGAKPFDARTAGLPLDVPAVYGIGGSLIYFIDQFGTRGTCYGAFTPVADPHFKGDFCFTTIDHLTNNVEKGTLNTWAEFYKTVFGFTEVRHFDIRGQKTGLYSFALRSPDGSFCIPINEGTETKSQIEEYLREYKGAGIQHLAFLTNDLLASLDKMQNGPVKFLDIDDEYYRTVFDRVKGVTEDKAKIKNYSVLVDGDENGYLLQIFTKNVIGPIFIELIQRKNHHSFGEGNFGALFRSIERDQERRGVL